MIIVTNPGTHPHLAHLAAEFARREEMRYLTSASWASDSALQRILRARTIARLPMAVGLRRRALPDGLSKHQVVRLAGFFEVAFYVSRRFGFRSSDRRMARRTARFQRAAAARVARSSPRILVAEYTGAAQIFSSAPAGTIRVLDYPIAHHRWVEREFETEAAQNPEWASFLQGRGMAPATVAQLDGEIEEADFVIVPSSFVRRTFVEMGIPEAKLIVSNLGAEETVVDFDPAVGGSQEGPLRLLFAGQVTQRKGLSYLLDAVRATPGVELHVIGHQPPGMRERLEGRERVTSGPSVDLAALDLEYERADLLVLPSLAEGFPLVAIGALSRGAPAVLTDSAAAEDLIEDGVHGFTVPSRDATALASVFSRASADRAALRRMRTAARERGRQFTWAAYARRTADAIEHRVNGR